MLRGLKRLLNERNAKRKQVIIEIRELVEELRSIMGKVTLLLYGSYSRGDFNIHSDVDILIVSNFFEGMDPLARLRVAQEFLPPKFEAKCFTPSEALKELRKPWWKAALEESEVIVDDFKILPKLRD